MVKKIAVSMPEPIFREMERTRKAEGKTRSEWLQNTVGAELRRRKHAEDVAAYICSYEEHPETADEIAEAEAWSRATPLWDDDEDWPEAPSAGPG